VSQRHAGWIALSNMYDDGGLSGGTMERPALKRLLEDIQAGEVQIVVVYKVDRLTRSLADFAKIVDIFDARNASFVSVTQQFNTTTSMGRLTLNMLLSFAQFEREIAGERIRDKIAASKRKGMWMGGNVPLGYDVKDRKLIVSEPEASTVRVIFRRYSEPGSVALLRAELDRQDIVSKRREGASGRNVSKPSSLMNAALLTSGKEHGLFSLSSRYQRKELRGRNRAPCGSPQYALEHRHVEEAFESDWVVQGGNRKSLRGQAVSPNC
jgi:DNA invertase Pin-like site-specific DNA recombinase